MRRASILTLLLIAAPAFGQPTKATVLPDTLSLHKRMSVASPVVVDLRQGDKVSIDFSVTTSAGVWCSVTQLIEDGRSGNVPCASLKRESAALPASLPLLPTTPAAGIPPAPSGTMLYLVALGGFRYVDLNTLVEYYQQKFGLQVRILPAIELDGASYDAVRKQYVAERLISLMKRNLEQTTRNRKDVVIGITEGDLYFPGEKWVFGALQGSNWAVVSTARMDWAHYTLRTPVDFNLLHHNLAKITSRYVGYLYYGLPVSVDPRSVLRQYVVSINDLNEIGEEF